MFSDWLLISLAVLLANGRLCTANHNQTDNEDNDEQAAIVDLYQRNHSSVVFLDAANFQQMLTGQRHVWLVQFYNSWCGHCQLYAPTWKTLAASVQQWRDVIRLGAINCARNTNLASVCRHHRIDGYPWLKWFPPQLPPAAASGDSSDNEDGMPVGAFGLRVQHMPHKGVAVMLNDIVDRLSDTQQRAHPVGWPHLGTVSSLAIFLQLPARVHALFIESSADSRLGRQVILDVSAWRATLAITRCHEWPLVENSVSAGNNSWLGIESLNVSQRPALLLFHANFTRQLVYVPESVSGGGRRGGGGNAEQEQRRFFTNTLLSLPSVGAVRQSSTAVSPDQASQHGQQQQPSSPHSGSASDMQQSGHAPTMSDLETALYYTLTHEVAGKHTISAGRLSALRAFVRLLVAHFPARPSVRLALADLQRHLLANQTSFSGEQLAQLLAASEHQLPTGEGWRSCRGSAPRYRGYTCALWQLFHTLLARAAVTDRLAASSLPVIHDYVKHFFSCSHCSQHFQQMSVRRSLWSVANAGEAVLWLWRAHNEVNARLAGDLTEDPRHIKQQWPPVSLCPHCYLRPSSTSSSSGNASVFRESAVAAFLLDFYTRLPSAPSGGPAVTRSVTTAAAAVMVDVVTEVDVDAVGGALDEVVVDVHEVHDVGTGGDDAIARYVLPVETGHPQRRLALAAGSSSDSGANVTRSLLHVGLWRWHLLAALILCLLAMSVGVLRSRALRLCRRSLSPLLPTRVFVDRDRRRVC